MIIMNNFFKKEIPLKKSISNTEYQTEIQNPGRKNRKIVYKTDKII